MNSNIDDETGMDSFYLLQAQNLTQEQCKVSLNHFNLLAVIGRGSFAKVLQVRKKDTKKIYALKVIKKSKLQHKLQQAQIQSERQILEKCQHQFIVKMEYAFQNDDKLYFCLEYCPGGELYNLLAQKGKLTEEQCKFYVAQIILALEYLHNKDIIYRDLKPENILIDVDGYLKLTDFGLSKQGVKGNDGANTRCGTAEYLAPEILAGSHGKAADWWTLGIIIYEMVTGQQPFKGESKEQLFDNILNKDINLKVGISPVLRDLLKGLLDKDPNSRMGSKNGATEIKQHKWLKFIEWEELLQKKQEAQFKPELNGEDDVSYFSETFIQESVGSNPGLLGIQEYYSGFSYNASPEKQSIDCQI